MQKSKSCSCNRCTTKIPNRSQPNWNWWLKMNPCCKSFLLNFNRTQMNQLVSVKHVRSSLCAHLAFTFSSNAQSIADDLWFVRVFFCFACMIIIVVFVFFFDRWFLSHLTVLTFQRLADWWLNKCYTADLVFICKNGKREKILIKLAIAKLRDEMNNQKKTISSRPKGKWNENDLRMFVKRRKSQ